MGVYDVQSFGIAPGTRVVRKHDLGRCKQSMHAKMLRIVPCISRPAAVQHNAKRDRQKGDGRCSPG